MSIFGSIDIETFMRDYWQKKPLLVRQAFPDFVSPIDQDELAGLALEEDVESRIVMEKGPKQPWQLLNGPFTEKTFAKLPPSHWTLLVQAVDQWVPEVASMLQDFEFIPHWRRDDIMISFAPEGGSVGPHYDNYDVFLIQAQGQRRWQTGQLCDSNTPRVEGTPLRIIADMQVEEEWVLEPGDMLYLPPRIAHNGVALNNCMTISVGFRAPSHADILQGFAAQASMDLLDEARYSDADLQPASNPGEIDAAALNRLKTVLNQYLHDDAKLLSWFGEFMTEPKYPELSAPLDEALEAEELDEALQQSEAVLVNESARFAYHRNANGITFFANGCEYALSGPAAELAMFLSDNLGIAADDLATFTDETSRKLLLELVNNNQLYMD
ncbi:MAG: cupin domain-containing protein [Oceanospirillaceae bacterium]|nr:cupin domain-containing protein [Oceanospirillaceae bacterium]MCP5334089.1 cupin domain-containing protein [Oceanospirillaceae bacterium]MCP5351275.1 cupin domain-containing protein [Oceanospirillaceae bacterium]